MRSGWLVLVLALGSLSALAQDEILNVVTPDDAAKFDRMFEDAKPKSPAAQDPRSKVKSEVSKLITREAKRAAEDQRGALRNQDSSASEMRNRKSDSALENRSSGPVNTQPRVEPPPRRK